jgi:hypothetical protein
MVAIGISALLFGGALQVNQPEHAANTPRTAAPTQIKLQALVNCNVVAFANSAKRAELMSFCSRSLIQTSLLQVSACFALLDAIHVADWRAARLLFKCARGLEQVPSRLLRLYVAPDVRRQ